MANLDYTAAPTVTARTDAPDDTQQIKVSPNAFGAGLAEAGAQLGQSVIDASKFYGRVATDQAINNTMQQQTTLFHGDPNKTVIGPDGQPMTDTGYLGMRGQNAMDAREPTAKAMDTIIANNRASLSTPESQLEYDNQTRRMREQWLEKMGAHADQQQQVWSIGTNVDKGAQWLHTQALNPADPALYDQTLKNVADAYVNIARFKGDETDEAAVQKAHVDVAKNQVVSLLETNPLAAKQALNNHLDVLAGAPGTYRLQQEVNARALDYFVGSKSDPAAVAAARASAPPTTPNTPAPDMSAVPFAQVKQQIIAKEAPSSLGGYNAIVYNKPDGGSAVGAQPPKPLTSMTLGEVVDYQNNVLRAQTAGHRGANDPGSTGVGAYQFESGTLAQNAQAALGPNWRDQPFTPANQDKIAETLYNQVRSDPAALGKTWAAFKGQGPVAADDDGGNSTYLAQVRQQAQSLGFGPNEVENAVKRVQFNIQRDDSAQVARVKDHVADTVSFLQDGGDPAKAGLTPAAVRAMVPGQRGADMASDLEAAQHYATAVNQLKTAPQAQVQQILTQNAPNGPDDYREKSAYFGALYKAAQARQVAIFGAGSKPGDPATYVHGAFPDVAQAFTTAIQGNDPNAFTGYVHKLQGAYGALGIPETAQRILPNATAAGIVGNLQKAQPGDALNFITSLQKESGTFWPQVYRDLVRGGLPTTFQTPLVVAQTSRQNAQTMVAAIQKDVDARANGKPLMDQEAASIHIGGKSVPTWIDQTISADPGLTSLRQTFGVAGKSGIDQFNGVRQTVHATALYLYLSGQVHDPASAAQQAAKMVTAIYDFVPQGSHPPARLPAGSADDFQQATQHVLGGLQPGAVRPYGQEVGAHGEAITVPPQELSEHALQSAKNAYWVTVPGADGQGAVRAIDPATGRPVILHNGSTLDIPFSRMKSIAAQRPDPTKNDWLADRIFGAN